MRTIREFGEGVKRLVLLLIFFTGYCDAVCSYKRTCNDVSLDCTNLNITLLFESLFNGRVYHCNGGRWVNVPGCVNLSATESCSLSTSIAYNRINNYNKLLIISTDTGECGFDFMPYKCATIGAPDIGQIEVGKDHVLLDVRAPPTPYTHTKDGNTTCIRMDDFFVSVSYRATLQDISKPGQLPRITRSIQLDQIQSNSGWFRFEQLESGTEYVIGVTAFLEYQEGDTASFYVETQAINECYGVNDEDTCDPKGHAVCANTSQTDRYQCECLSGWTGNGLECKDVEKPVISNIPNDIVKDATLMRMHSTATWFEPTAEDNSGGCTLVSDYRSGATFPIGTTVVTYTAIDAANNQQTAVFIIRIRGMRSVLSIVMILLSVVLLYMIVKLRQCDRSSSKKFRGIDPNKSRTLARTVGVSGYTPSYKKEIEVFDECSVSVSPMQVTVNPISPPPPYIADYTVGCEISSNVAAHEISSDVAAAAYEKSSDIAAQLVELRKSAHLTTEQPILSSSVDTLADPCNDIDTLEVNETMSGKENADLTGVLNGVISMDYDVSSKADDVNSMVAHTDEYTPNMYSVASLTVAGAASERDNVAGGFGARAKNTQNTNQSSGYVLDERRPLLSPSNKPHRCIDKEYITETPDRKLITQDGKCLESEDLTSMEKFCAEKVPTTTNVGLPSPGYSKLSQIFVDRYLKN